ncbi:hypothetical protein [Nocardia sp. BMG51109]|uniref:hypothetical protein n=1 Tax=Nocardia sp. BMG51109 TaxID=1056816 RepID=UPI0004675D53|nr:hypothetical protein [Nocardia sp. BMG51109]
MWRGRTGTVHHDFGHVGGEGQEGHPDGPRAGGSSRPAPHSARDRRRRRSPTGALRWTTVPAEGEAGRSAYRLYHHALAEHLRTDTDPARIHADFLHVLRSRVPAAADGRRDWARAHPYSLAHAATHAAAAGAIDDLITDVDYLVHAEPTALLAALHAAGTESGRLIRSIYRSSAADHRHLPRVCAANYSPSTPRASRQPTTGRRSAAP